MSIRLIFLPVFLLCAAYAARAPGIESLFLDAVNKLPLEVSLVKNCGSWEAGGKHGDYRMIVANVSNGVGNELYVQWIEVKKDSSRHLLTTLAFPELNNDHAQYAFESVSCAQKGKRVSIEIKASFEHDEGGEVHDISIELVDVGTYRLVDKVRKP
jgi:hypothetical protein